ncbi:Nucleolar protein 14 [Hondaea fermentalgiana]|uniref:Nucleolar protein 14 n=1 Tax=Hondaea fermentalgiana TaxID=2315210 RepID=A0A2R5GMW8_9STRA|nr:Nucleolar protein 14 [Hondaea fermentalgiana]|eukprot:GBG31965.1 Nucleolar protein 14 [Hondaea fermentalgiana]
MGRAGRGGKARKDLSGAFNAKNQLKKNNMRQNGKAALGKKAGKAVAAKAAALSNPFEERDNRRQKRNVLNRNLKGAKRNVALARSLAHEKRKRTLLGEFKDMQKANSFQDRRFGEQNESLTEEEKVLERFKRLRSKRQLYDLSDTDAAAEARKRARMQLTHLGQSLAEGDGADMEMEEELQRMLRAEGLDEDEDDDPREKLDANALMEQIKASSNNDDRSKSKKDVMQEVIAKAKMFKLTRQKEKEQDEEERERLDDAFKGLMKDGLFHMRPTRKERQQKEMDDMLARLQKAKQAKAAAAEGETQEAAAEVDTAAENGKKQTKSNGAGDYDDDDDEEDEFDKTVRGLVFEARAAASDRSLKPEEKAKRELEKLKEQQEALERRMKGQFSDEESLADDDLDEGRGKKSRRKKKGNAGSADAFFGEGAEDAKEDEEDEDDDEEEEENEVDEEDDDDDDEDADDELERHLLEEMARRKKEEESKNKAKQRTRKGVSIDRRADLIAEAKEELPFVIAAPESHADFLEFLDKYQGATKIAEVVTRIRKSNSIHLLAENRGKMRMFLEILIDHYVWLVERHAAQANDFGEEDDEDAGMEGKKTYKEVLDACLAGIYEVCHEIPESAGQIFCNRLSRMQLTLGKQLANAAAFGASAGGDYGCESTHLTKGGSLFRRKRGGHKVLVDFCKGAERLPAEAFLVVDALLNQTFVPKRANTELGGDEEASLAKKRVCPQLVRAGRMGVRVKHLAWLRKARTASESAMLSLQFLRYMEEDTHDVSHVNCEAIVVALLSLASQLGDVGASSPSGDVLLQGIESALARASSSAGKSALQAVQRGIESVQRARKPMRLLDVKARAIQSIRPLYNENYKWTKDGHDPDRDRAELKKLKRQAHRERKGVARELRKDAQFLAEQREMEKQAKSSALRAARHRNFEQLNTQAGEMNKAVRSFGATGGGSRNVDMRGRRRQTRS